MLSELKVVIRVNGESAASILDKTVIANKQASCIDINLEKIDINSYCNVICDDSREIEASDYEELILLVSEDSHACVYKDAYGNAYLQITTTYIQPMVEAPAITNDCELIPIKDTNDVDDVIVDLKNWNTIYINNYSEYSLTVEDLEVVQISINDTVASGDIRNLDIAINY